MDILTVKQNASDLTLDDKSIVIDKDYKILTKDEFLKKQAQVIRFKARQEWLKSVQELTGEMEKRENKEDIIEKLKNYGVIFDNNEGVKLTKNIWQEDKNNGINKWKDDDYFYIKIADLKQRLEAVYEEYKQSETQDLPVPLDEKVEDTDDEDVKTFKFTPTL